MFYLWILSVRMTPIDPLEIRLHILLSETLDNHRAVVLHFAQLTVVFFFF